MILHSDTEGKDNHPLFTQSDIPIIFINIPVVWKQNTDVIFRYNRLKPVFSTLNDQIKQQEVACLSTARPATLQLPDETVDLGTRYCLCFLNLSAQDKRFLRTLRLAFQGYLKKKRGWCLHNIGSTDSDAQGACLQRKKV